MQALNDLLTGAHVRRGGQGDARHTGKKLGQLAQLQVFRAEVMAPLRHAMRLVDGEQGDLQALQKGQHARLHQAFRGQVEHLYLAAVDPLGDLALLLGIQGGVQRHRRHPQFVEGGDLVVHQGDQGRHHHRQTLAQQGRHLKAQRLAAAGRHQHQGVAAARHALDDRALAATEAVITENVFEDAQCLVEHERSPKRAAHYTHLLAGLSFDVFFAAHFPRTMAAVAGLD
ncbi:hypothetical protein D3C85_891060 [compost metagenome]